ncbi:MAG TPA: DNA primase [Magnetococcales bacterium]|nr:DNA primase [Magnetococcales bacterium]
MPRYPDRFIEEVRERVDLLGLVGRHVQLKKSGTNWLGLCPFHNEKTPSFSVRPDRGFFKCFGCGQGGDAFEFVMKLRGMTFNETVEELAATVGLPLPVAERGGEISHEKGKHRAQLFNVLSQASDFFHSLLMSDKGRKALEYFQERGLTESTIRRFRLGYAPPGWQTLAEHFKGMTNAPGLLEEVGLRINKGDASHAYDRFRDRVIFPIHDLKGRCVGFGGRTLDPQGKPKYINSPETVLYQKGQILYGLHQSQEAIQKRGEVILVEGYMDLISLASHGVDHCVATLGTALTDEQLRLIWQRSRKVIYCFDGDNAGRQAAWKALEKSMDGLEADRHVRFLFLPQGIDPDQFIRRHGREEFLALAEKAIGLIEFLTERLGMDLTLSHPEGKAALVARMRPYLLRVSDPLLKELFVDSLAKKINIPAWTIFRTPRPGPMLGLGGNKKNKKGSLDLPPLGGRDLERTLLGLLLRFPELISEHEETLASLRLNNPEYSGLLEVLVAMGPAILSGGNVLDLENLPGDAWSRLAIVILTQEEVVPEYPKEELANCLELLQIKRLDTLKKQTHEEKRFNTETFADSCRRVTALQLERRRLMASRGSRGH